MASIPNFRNKLVSLLPSTINTVRSSNELQYLIKSEIFGEGLINLEYAYSLFYSRAKSIPSITIGGSSVNSVTAKSSFFSFEA